MGVLEIETDSIQLYVRCLGRMPSTPLTLNPHLHVVEFDLYNRIAIQAKTAHDLKKVWPEIDLQITFAGHSARESENSARLVQVRVGYPSSCQDPLI
jgi:hypothetical protein